MRRIVPIVVILLLLAACSAGPSQRPAVAYRDSDAPATTTPPPPRPALVPALDPPTQDSVRWTDCTDQTRAKLGVAALAPGTRFGCSVLLTALDAPDNPGQGTSRMAVLSVGSGTIPLVVVNDVEGEPGTTYAARLALRMPPELLRTFRLVGVDRRGTGQSDPVQCVPPAQREAIAGFDPQATERPTLDRLVDAVRSSSQKCLGELPDRLQAYDTWRAAADLETLRSELSVPRLHAIGRGEGSRVLTTYADRYPQNVGRMVLDGAPDPQGDAIPQSEQRAQGAEHAFDAFTSACVATGCPLEPDPRRTVGDLLERTRTRPIPAGPAQVTAGTVVQGVLAGLSDQTRWPALTAALDAANRGDGTGIENLIRPLLAGAPILDATLVTTCNDTAVRVPTQRGANLAADWVHRYPLFGGVFAQRLVWCGLWPVPQQTPPAPRASGLPPIPVITTDADPLTPALGSQHMAGQLPGSSTIDWQGAGHGALGTSPCATDAAMRFLIEGRVPVNTTACPA